MIGKKAEQEASALWQQHNADWRDPTQIVAQWKGAGILDPLLLRYRVYGKWWETLAATNATLIVTREYEHLVIALNANFSVPNISYFLVPHPSGLAVDSRRGLVYLASTRNPNQIFELAPVADYLPRLDSENDTLTGEFARPLIPIRSRFYPGCFYIHDLALIGETLYANSVGQNAVIRFDEKGDAERVWWPKCIENETGPVFGQNHLQLNSIAAGKDLESSFFSASTDKISSRRPGHQNFPVDRRGVVFSGATREPIGRGLTRPHSARLHREQIWVDNSGYGEVGFIEQGVFVPVSRLPGWTRGLCITGTTALVGTSRVLPRFTQYAPGLDLNRSVCGVHAVDIRSGEVLGGIIWPYGNQIFAIDLAPVAMTAGFPFQVGGKRSTASEKKLFYAFQFTKDKL